LFALYFIAIATGASLVTGTTFSAGWLRSFASACVNVLIVYFVLELCRRWQLRYGIKVGSYLVFPSVSVLLAMGFRWISGEIDPEWMTNLWLFSAALLRNLVGLFLVLSILGTVSYRITRGIRRAEEALELARTQQKLILDGDENTRRQVAQVLHDKVQAGLIAACLELNDVSTALPASEANRIRNIANKIEGIRARDVRAVARTLHPSLEDIDIQSAIEELAAVYEPMIDTRITIDPRVESPAVDAQRLLGIYRIIEQAILNCAQHGSAREVEINVAWTETDDIAIAVVDNGKGLSATSPRAGVGFALYSTWCRNLGGTWSLDSAPLGGAILTAQIPVRA